MDIITIGNNKGIFKFGLEFGKGAADAEAEEKRTKAETLLASSGVKNFSKAGSRFEKDDA